MNNKLPLGQLLIEEELITAEQLDEALDYQKTVNGKRLGDVLVEKSYLTERQMLRTLAKKLNLEYLDAPLYKVDKKAVELVPQNLIKDSKILPLYVEDGTLFIATYDPLDFYSIEDVRMATGLHIETVVSSKEEITTAQNKALTSLSTDETLTSLSMSELTDDDLNDLENMDMNDRIDSAPIVKLLNNIVIHAIQVNASDIHVEPTETEIIVRYRIDGDLHQNMTLSTNIHQLIVTRIKIMSGINIAERRIPQDGRFRFNYGMAQIDMRVSTLPTIYGEKVVMRLLGSNADVNYQLADMGFLPQTLNTLRNLMKFSNGIILCTGPTGSGKTTTLYSMLKEIIDPKTNIVTLEDPVEKRMLGINQVQVNSRAGLNFANGLRSILRQDPDVILIGEIRDSETADIAIRASITGHLVLSTLHTNDSFSSIARLADMGVEHYLIADSIRGIIAQRLVKKLCPKCKEVYYVTKDEKTRLKDDSLTMAYRPKGCDFCNNTGYKGRIAVNEILTMNSDLRRLVVNPDTDIETLRDYGRSIHMRMMKDDLIVLINSGVTSVEEAVKIVYSVE